MEAWTIIGSIAGVLALLGLPTAFWIHQRQNRATKQISVTDREQKIYRGALDALDEFDASCAPLKFNALPRDELNNIDSKGCLRKLELFTQDPATPLSKDVSVRVELTNLSAMTVALQSVTGLPSRHDLSYALSSRKSDEERAEREVVSSAIKQQEIYKEVSQFSVQLRGKLSDYRAGIVRR